MEQFEAILKFDEYIVTKATYNLNDNFIFDENNELEVDFDLYSTVDLRPEFDTSVLLEVNVGDKTNINCPFVIEVAILGKFSFEGDEETKESFMTSSALAILFPYVRSIVSELSDKSNIFPAFKLPLINIVSYLNDGERINIIRD